MLGISGTELVIILFFGFLIFGPEKLPQMGRTVGRAIRQFRQASDSMNKKFQEEVKDPFEEAVAPVKDAVNGAGAPIRDDINAISDNLNGIKSTITDPFKDVLRGTSTPAGSGKTSSAAETTRKAAVVSGGAATAASSSAKAPSGKPAAKPAADDGAFADPFADIGTGATSAESTPDEKSEKPKGQPLPKSGGTVKKSIASSLYDLDDSSADSADAPKGGE